MKQNTRFRHESLQDQGSIKRLLRALTTGIGKGKVVLEDEDGSMIMEPGGLLNLKITASQNDESSKLNIRLSWREDRDQSHMKDIKISSK